MGFSLKKKLSFRSKKSNSAYKEMEYDVEGNDIHTQEVTPTSSAYEGQNVFASN